MSLKSHPEKVFEKIQNQLQLHLYQSAIFFAQKLVQLEPGETSVYWFAQSCFLDGQYQRAYTFLQRDNWAHRSIRCRYLAARCMFMTKKYDTVLSLLEDISTAALFESTDPTYPRSIKIAAACHVLHGQVLECLQNQKMATSKYMDALKEDPFCSEAIEKLVQYQRINVLDGMKLVSSLKVEPDFSWLFSLYNIMIQQNEKYETVSKRLSIFDTSYNLSNDPDRQVVEAELLFNEGRLMESIEICKKILDEDIYHQQTILLYLSLLYETRNDHELYRVCHPLMEDYPDHPIASYAVGCYYMSINNLDIARKFFSKSVKLNSHFSPGWIAYGHSFALCKQDENDQATAAYRTCLQLMRGSHIPHIYIAIQYRKMHDTEFAMSHFEAASSICRHDPLLIHEIGVFHYERREYKEAAEAFKKVLSVRKGDSSDNIEPTLFNLGHCYRKLGKFDEALDYYQRAAQFNNRNGSTNTAIGLTYQLKGNLMEACEHYHKALELSPGDDMATGLLEQAVKDSCQAPVDLLPIDSDENQSLSDEANLMTPD